MSGGLNRNTKETGMDDTHATNPGTLASSSKPATKPSNPVRRLTLVVIAIGILLFGYGILSDRLTPFTSQGTVQAYLVGVAPEIPGKVISINAEDNKRVEPGAILFELDPEQYRLAVQAAEAQLETAGQSIGASTAAVASAEAKLAEATAKRANVREQVARIRSLVKQKVYSQARADQAKSQFSSAEAEFAAAEAELEKAKQTLGPQGADNPQIKLALSQLQQAQLDLSRTRILAPSDGGISNLRLAIGQVLSKGEIAMTFIDVREIWIDAAFRENSLENIRIGDPVDIALDVLPGRLYRGRVQTIGYGVANGDESGKGGLPSLRHQSGWIIDPQPMPVRIAFDEPDRPRELRVGSQASAIVYTGDNKVMNAIGLARIWLVTMLSYVR